VTRNLVGKDFSLPLEMTIEVGMVADSTLLSTSSWVIGFGRKAIKIKIDNSPLSPPLKGGFRGILGRSGINRFLEAIRDYDLD
jgi:hypothetical protein